MSLRTAEIREMPKDERDKHLQELRSELMNEKGIASMGGQPNSPGRMRSLKRQIARIETIKNEEKIGGGQ